jgi:RNA-directed DNA polymerase
MAKGHPSYRMIRYADDFVILVRGTKAQAQALKEQTAEFMREQMRLTLSPEKTHITHVDDGFDFLGFRIKRLPRRRIPIAYSFPSERSFRDIKHRIKELTGRSNIGLSLDELVHSLNPTLRGWTNYHRHAASKRCFSYLDHYLWWRVMLWLRKKHPRMTWKQIRRRYWGRQWTSPDGTRLYWPGQVPVTRYRYRGHRIPTPWAPPDKPGPPPAQEQALLELHHDRPAVNPVERRMRGNAHVRCGGRGRANHRAQARHGGSPPTLHRDRPPHPAQRETLARR